MVRISRQTPAKRSVSRKNLLLLGFGLIGLYVVLPQIKSFHDSLGVVRAANIGWSASALLASALSYLAAASVYIWLAKKPLRYGRTVLLQVASMFANKLLPAGIGAIGINYEFLRRSRHSSAQAIAVIATNNALGFVGNLLLLVAAFMFSNTSMGSIRTPHIHGWVYAVGSITIVVIGAVMWRAYGKRVRRALRGILLHIVGYRRHPLRLIMALASSIVLTASYTMCLYACLMAVGVHLPLDVALVTMSLGVVGGTVVPTPGGLGGAEAALAGGLLLYGVSSPHALAAVLLYRLVTYWFALVIGAMAFAYVVRRRYV